MRRLNGVLHFCVWCGKRLNGHTYIIQGAFRFCSEKCWAAWHNDRREDRKARERMDDERG